MQSRDDSNNASANAPNTAGRASSVQTPPETQSATNSLLPSLSLPKGGGAIQGIGETFSTNPATGAGTASVPLAISPGRSGFGPELSVSYSSGAGNSPFGQGWSVPVPSISRKTSRGIPKYLDGTNGDAFVLAGAEDLVPVGKVETPLGAAFSVQRYRPRVEGLFARIEQWTRLGDGDTHWRVYSRDNVLSVYGPDSESRIADPNETSHVFTWLLRDRFDDRGNAMRYQYRQEDGVNVDQRTASEEHRVRDGRFSATAQRYIHRIWYGNTAPVFRDDAFDGEQPVHAADWHSADRWLFEVEFDYGDLDAPSAEESARPGTYGPGLHADSTPDPAPIVDWPVRRDPFSTYRAGFEIRTYRLCRRVLMFHRFPELERDRYLVRSTDFEVDESEVMSFLRSVTHASYRWMTASGAYERATVPAVSFEYSTLAYDTEVHRVDKASLAGLPDGVDGNRSQWLDLDGDGLPGVLTRDDAAWRYKKNLGAGQLGPTRVLDQLPTTAALGSVVQLSDLGGDGNLDLVSYAQPLPGFVPRNDDGGWGQFREIAELPNLDWGDPNLRFVDLDGDGLADVAITTGDGLIWYRSLAKEGFASGEFVPHSIDPSGPDVVFSSSTEAVVFADMTGDGLSDIVRVSDSFVCYWPNLGHGRFGVQVVPDRQPSFDSQDQFDPGRIRLADLDGSGTTDLIYLKSTGCDVYLNQAGNSFQDAFRVPLTFHGAATITVTDLCGNGTSCIVRSSQLNSDAETAVTYVELSAGIKPHLLTEIHNNMGAETRLSHASSTKFSLASTERGEPWVTKLPFPVHTVEAVTTIDRVANTRFSTKYEYHHGYFDGHEREFGGFALVDQYDTQVFELDDAGVFSNESTATDLPPAKTRTWFHTGAWLERATIEQFFTDPGRSGSSAYWNPVREGSDAIESTSLFLDDTVMPSASNPPLNADEEREVCRALRGQMLRQEVYGLDGGPLQDDPYITTERNAAVELLGRRADHRHAVVHVHEREKLTHNYERRRDDPRISHQIVLSVDRWGNVTRGVDVAYGRTEPRADSNEPVRKHEPAQKQTWIVYSENSFTNEIDETRSYRTPLAAESTSFELTGYHPTNSDNGLLTKEDFADADSATIDPNADISYELGVEDDDGRKRRVIERSRTLYRPDALVTDTGETLLATALVESLALPGETYKLAFTPGLLDELGPLSRPNPDAGLRTPLVNDVSATLGGTGPGEGGYLDLDGEGMWWVPSGRVFLTHDDTADTAEELAEATRDYFLSKRSADAFGATAILRWDDHLLLPIESVDPVGNLTTVGVRNTDDIRDPSIAGYDYRTLQPLIITDANQNRAEVAIDIRGMTVATARRGKLSESVGDSIAGIAGDLTPEEIAEVISAPHGGAARRALGDASTRMIYDTFAFARTAGEATRAPVALLSLLRETHVSDLDPGDPPTRIQRSFTYSDGLGRVVQERHQAEPGPLDPSRPNSTFLDQRWVVSGLTIFNNKGLPAHQSEPTFSRRHDFRREPGPGVERHFFYDPLGRSVATLNPDATYVKTTFDAWTQKIWDENDTVLWTFATDPDVVHVAGAFPESWKDAPSWYGERTAPGTAPADSRAAYQAAIHHDTPSTAHLDALGRAILTVEVHTYFNDRTDRVMGPDEFETRVEFDIEGNERVVRDAVTDSDPKGRMVMVYDYDMLGNRIREMSMDAGSRWLLADAAGAPIRAWDARGHVQTNHYDIAHRPVRSTLSEPGSTDKIVVNRVIYGDQLTGAARDNLRGLPALVLEQSGAIQMVEADFKGNSILSSVRLKRTGGATTDWSTVDVGTDVAPTTVDLADVYTAAAPQLEAPESAYASATTYDALDRPIQETAPYSSAMVASATRRSYNQAGLLETVEANVRGAGWVAYVQNVEYDVRGQRNRIDYGNDTKTVYSYDPLTFRLRTIKTTRTSGHTRFQDLSYTYDPAGNITQIDDNAQVTLFFGGSVVGPERRYIYDSLYRLVAAWGREHLGQTGPHPHEPEDKAVRRPLPTDGTKMGNYVERYDYDPVGNLLAMTHTSLARQFRDDSWTRTYAYEEASEIQDLTKPRREAGNRLTSTTIGSITSVYPHDPNGNITRMPHLSPAPKNMYWDRNDQLQSVDLGTGGSVAYDYDDAGERVRKSRLNDGSTDERVYLGPVEIYTETRTTGGGSTERLIRETLHVTDGDQRIALVETRTRDDGRQDPAPQQLIRYQIADHLKSSTIELDGNPRVISYEEYSPYGSTTVQSTAANLAIPKRYRFTGKESDEETGFNYHSARYLAPWLGRWTSSDPVGLVGGLNAFAYAGLDPLGSIDPTGLINEPVPQQRSFAQARVFDQRVITTRSTRGFTGEVRANFRKLMDMWGESRKMDIAHPAKKPFWSLRSGAPVDVHLEERGINRSDGAKRDKPAKARAKKSGRWTRNRNTDTAAKKGKHHQQPSRNAVTNSPEFKSYDRQGSSAARPKPGEFGGGPTKATRAALPKISPPKASSVQLELPHMKNPRLVRPPTSQIRVGSGNPLIDLALHLAPTVAEFLAAGLRLDPLAREKHSDVFRMTPRDRQDADVARADTEHRAWLEAEAESRNMSPADLDKMLSQQPRSEPVWRSAD